MMLLLKWMLACGGSLAASLLVWAVLRGATRIWPALLSRRAVWMAAQCVIVASALLPFLPHGSLGSTPPLTLAVSPLTVAQPAPLASQPLQSVVPLTAAVMAPSLSTEASSPGGTLSSMGFAALPAAASLWLLVYAAGLAYAVIRLLRARRLWRGLLASARPVILQAVPRGLTVMMTSAPISPMLAGVRRSVLLLPEHLNTFSAEQQQMILAHELHHWRVRDPLWLGIAGLLRVVFWFNPALRWLSARMEWAMELSCDQHVLVGRPQHQRQQYAASLLLQWKMAMLPAYGAAFGSSDGATVAARIQQMQRNGLPALPRQAACLIGVLLSAVLATAFMLQPALALDKAARTDAAAQKSMLTQSVAQAAAPWRAPLDNMRVTSFFGVQRDVLPTPHKGIDLAAHKGTPVHATANGVVIAAGAIAENNGRYGNTVVIEHGGRRSLYAHLDSVAVTAGQRVGAGQLIGVVGETGFATGPHLHFEIRQGDTIIDPATMLSDLDAHASKRALRVRDQQLPRKG